MSTNSDTSAIDDKKSATNNTSGSLYSDIGNFAISVFTILIIIVFYLSFGGIILYGCKLAQSNILPTDSESFPYTNVKQDIKSVTSNIFTTFTDPAMSMKMNFPYEKYNASNTILDLFREYKNEPNSNFMANYFISIMESLISFNYASFNYIFNFLNGAPETVILLFGPIIASFATSIIFLMDIFYFMYLWFSNMGWFFKENTNVKNTGEPNWENVTILEPINYWIAIALVILFFILFWVVLVFALPVLPFITMAWCIFSSLGYGIKIDGHNGNILTLIKHVFKHYKVSVMSILSFFIILSAFSNLGTIPGVFSIITLVLIIFGVFSIGIFKTTGSENLTPVVSNEQAKKISNIKATPVEHGFFQDLFFPQKGGKKLVNELKKLGKKLQE
jgi:hypothetical protein